MAGSRYTTVEDVKRRVQKTDDEDDLTIFSLILAAENAIDNFCNRPDGFLADATASARYYTGNGQAVLLIDECVAISEVAVKDAATDTSYTAWNTPTTNMANDGDWLAFSGDPENPDFNALPYDSIMVDPTGDESVFTSGRFLGLRGFRPEGSRGRSVATVRVTARWGYATTAPAEIAEAAAMQATIWYKRFQGSGASVLASPEMGTIELFRTLDPMVELILSAGRYVKPATGRR